MSSLKPIKPSLIISKDYNTSNMFLSFDYLSNSIIKFLNEVQTFKWTGCKTGTFDIIDCIKIFKFSIINNLCVDMKHVGLVMEVDNKGDKTAKFVVDTRKVPTFTVNGILYLEYNSQTNLEIVSRIDKDPSRY